MEDRTFITLIKKYKEKFGFRIPYFSSVPKNNHQVSVVIPCYNEPDILPTLNSLLVNEFKGFSVEVIVVVNHSEVAVEEVKLHNSKTSAIIESFAKEKNTDQLKFLVYPAFDLPKKHAGVGLARKIGMDEATYRFAQNGTDGIILAFDADSLCETNYLQTIFDHFNQSKTPAVSIHFEHPTDASKQYSQSVIDAIIDYELHLRYYKNALAYVGHPFAFHTIGSSMAVKASAYTKQGGMNRRKAGEDFYFLSKMMLLGDYSEITETKVIPSPRVSDRVPFGTGKAVGEILEQDEDYLTYNPKTFELLKQDFKLLLESFNSVNYKTLSKEFQSFVNENEFEKVIANAKKNSSNEQSYLRRIFQYFDAFWVLKYVHYVRDYFLPNISVRDASIHLIKLFLEDHNLKDEVDSYSSKELLNLYRKIDLKQVKTIKNSSFEY